MRLVCMPWYDLPETRAAHDALWARMAAELRRGGLAGIPDAIDWTVPYTAQWDRDDLLFGQACGYDVLLSAADVLQPIATPRYRIDGCVGHQYRSLVVVADSSAAGSIADLRGSRCVINTPSSHSGTNVLRALVAPLHAGGRFFSSVTISGAHERSLALIRAGHADVAAVDCVTYGLIRRHRPAELCGTRVMCETAAVPAPPYVTSRATGPDEVALLRRAVAVALADPALAGVRDQLAIAGADVLPVDAYAAIDELRRAADEAGYFEIAPA
jgi:ABC-type phosphate/phosphonate transport system substrate-binding protein